MMVRLGVPKVLWRDVVFIVAYIVNRTLSSALEGKTPEKKRFGKLPNYSYLRVFGCTAYSHQNLGKQDPRSQ